MRTTLREPRFGSPLPMLLLVCSLAAVGILSACSQSTEPEPNPEPERETLLLSELYAAMVNGGTETIVASSSEGGIVTAVSGDPSIAQVTQEDNLIHINAANHGKTTVTVTAENGRTREVPVTVYDPQVLDNGELQIKFVKDFQNLFYSREHYGFWFPDTAGGFHPLGVVVHSRYDVVAVVRAAEGSDAVAPPDSFNLLWCPHFKCDESGEVVDISLATYGGWGQPFQMTFWKPVPRPGYKALGLWAQVDRSLDASHGTGTGLCAISENPLVCIREDLVASGQRANAWLLSSDTYSWLFGTAVFSAPCGDSQMCGWWVPCYEWQANEWQTRRIRLYNVDPRSTVGEEYALLPVETVAAAVEPVTVPPDGEMNLLRVELPRVDTGQEVFILPEMTSIQEPTEPTAPMAAWEVVIPYMMIDDEMLPPEQQFTYSPLYRLERRDFYVPKVYTRNVNETPLPWEYSIEHGIKSSTIDEVWQEYKIEISTSAGIRIKGIFDLQTRVSISKKLGYRHSSEYEEWTVDRQTFSPTIPPHTAACVWQKMSRFILKRHNGTTLEEVKTWDAPSSTHILTMYPPAG